MSDGWYTEAEQRAIDTAGRQAAHSMQKLRDRDESHRKLYVSWDAVSAGQGPNYSIDDEGN